MNAELEALLAALDAVHQARSGSEAKAKEALYWSRLDDVLERHPALSRESLLRAIDVAYLRWVQAQQKPSSLPVKA